MHWTVLFAFAWMYLIFWNVVASVIASVAFFALLVAHEYGHIFVLRRRRSPVASVTLFGIHGTTDYSYAKPKDEMLVAWGGVGAQLVILALALAFAAFVDLQAIPLAALVAGPVLVVFTKLNVFVMVVALLPIGPFDGRKAWAVIPMVRSALKRRKRAPRAPKLSAEERRALEASSERAAADLLAKLTKKPDTTNEDMRGNP
jgi:Zn-dependent protease